MPQNKESIIKLKALFFRDYSSVKKLTNLPIAQKNMHRKYKTPILILFACLKRTLTFNTMQTKRKIISLLYRGDIFLLNATSFADIGSPRRF